MNNLLLFLRCGRVKKESQITVRPSVRFTFLQPAPLWVSPPLVKTTISLPSIQVPKEKEKERGSHCEAWATIFFQAWETKRTSRCCVHRKGREKKDIDSKQEGDFHRCQCKTKRTGWERGEGNGPRQQQSIFSQPERKEKKQRLLLS